MIERRARRRRDGTGSYVWRVRFFDSGRERSKTFDRAADARAFEAKVRTLKRTDALTDLDAGTETLAEFVGAVVDRLRNPQPRAFDAHQLRGPMEPACTTPTRPAPPA